ncbi:MAG TPA: hypothetical protein VGO48_07500 [Conexibacter sp.]|jgi:hypothetical protein|nr:hypothetical protein [Conexibacter sp.]
MLHRARVLALPLGFALAMAIGACGSGDAQESGATVAPSPLTTPTTAPTTTATTTATTTVPTTTTAPATTTTAPATTPTTTQPSGGATTTQPTTGFAGGARGAPAGCPSAIGGFIRDVRATDCGVARNVATAWFAAVRGGAAPDSAIDAAGYSCSGTLAGERASVTCSGSGGTVSFTASP